MAARASASLLHLPAHQTVVPAVETRAQLAQALASSQVSAVVLHHCNLFECASLLAAAQRQGCAAYVNVDRIEGIQADAAGLRYIAEHFHVTGVISIHAKTLASAKQLGLETVQGILAVDSTGLDVTLQSVDANVVDLLDFLPALAGAALGLGPATIAHLGASYGADAALVLELIAVQPTLATVLIADLPVETLYPGGGRLCLPLRVGADAG
jgi:glycerol-3-phosphate responsive antiterminator